MSKEAEHLDATIYKIIEENANDIIGVIDMQGVFRYASPSHRKILGFLPINAGETFKYVHREDMAAIRQAFTNMTRYKKPQVVEFRCTVADTRPLWLEMEATPVLNESGEVHLIIMITRNVTERKIYEEKLKDMAFHDPLTGLPNRRLFSERMNQAIAYGKRNKEKFALISIDWNNFKEINDSMGHDVGDQFLKEFALKIGRTLREVDTIARLGGDEFIILLPHIINEENAERVARRIFNVVNEAWLVAGYSYRIAIGAGISIYPDDGDNELTLLKNADEALYKAKNLGNNHFLFYSQCCGKSGDQ